MNTWPAAFFFSVSLVDEIREALISAGVPFTKIEEILAGISAADEDGDGKLDVHEFVRILTRFAGEKVVTDL